MRKLGSLQTLALLALLNPRPAQEVSPTTKSSATDLLTGQGLPTPVPGTRVLLIEEPVLPVINVSAAVPESAPRNKPFYRQRSRW